MLLGGRPAARVASSSARTTAEVLHCLYNLGAARSYSRPSGFRPARLSAFLQPPKPSLTQFVPKSVPRTFVRTPMRRRSRYARAMRRISFSLAIAIICCALCGQVALGATRHAVIVVRENFSGRFGIPIEGFQVFLELTRARDNHVLVNRAVDVDQHSIRLVVAPGQYRLKRYVREGGPIVCIPTSTCTPELGLPSTSCSYRVRLGSAQVLSLLVTATSRECAIRRTR